MANIYHAFGIHSFVGECAHAAGKDEVEYVLALLGPDRIIPKSELPKDYTNYDSDLAQYPLDTARYKRVVQLAAEKSGLGQKEIGQWLWDGNRRTPEFFDLCGDRCLKPK